MCPASAADSVRCPRNSHTPRRLRGLTAMLTCLLTLTIPLPALLVASSDARASQSTDDAGIPLEAPSSSVLPPWAKTYEQFGDRELWLQPFYFVNDPRSPWDEAALLSNVNSHLSWFTVASRGNLTVSATKVLQPIILDEDGCNPLVRDWSVRMMRWKESNPPKNVHLVGLSRVTTCPWGGLGATPGNHMILSGMGEAPRVRGNVLIHEFGHNLGLPHAAAYRGSVLSTVPENAHLDDDISEYGDPLDPMGISSLIELTQTFNPASMAALGWGEGVLHASSPGDHSVELFPVITPGPDAITFDDPVSGTRYMLTYNENRDPRGRLQGVFLYESRYDAASPEYYGRGDSSFARLIPFAAKYPWFGAGTGTSWVAPTGGVMFQVEAVGDGSASVTVTIDPTGSLTDSHGPSWFRGEPTLRRVGKAVFVTVPSAWDQSGVVVAVSVNGSRFRTVENADIAKSRKVRFSLSSRYKKSVSRVAVRLADSHGNTTLWSGRVRKGRANGA